MTLRPRVAGYATGLTVCLLLACSADAPDDSGVMRGRGLKPAPLAPAAEAAMFDAAVRASFDVEPSLVLMVHPRRLPRTSGYDGGEPVPPALVQALRERGIVRGMCEPKHERPRDTPRCGESSPGYVVRATTPFRAARDTIQINFAAEAFGAQAGARPQALRFEKIYQLVGRDDTWSVVREARVREPR